MVTPTATSASTGAGKGRTYTFNVSWLKIFPWLEFENNLNLCKYCRGQNQAGNSSFVSGNTHLKSDSITKHNVSQQHIQCRDLYLRKEKSSGTVSAVLLSEEEKRRQLKIKMNIAYFIAKDEEPFVKFGPLIRLHRKNAVDINPTYNNDVRCAEMISQIADIMRDSLSAKLKAAKCLAVLIDGDIDISNTECEIVYVRLLENGKPVNLLVGQQTLEHSHAIAENPNESSIVLDELGVDICTLSSIPQSAREPSKCSCSIDLATDQGQYSVVLQHMEHLAVAPTTVKVQGQAKKVSFVWNYPHLASLCKGMTWSSPKPHLKTVTRLEELKAGDMLEKIQTMLAQQKSDGRRFQGITLKGNLKGFTDLTNPQLKQHMEAAINICVGELKASVSEASLSKTALRLQKEAAFGSSPTEDLMRISLEGPSVEEFDPTPAVNRWLSSKRPPDVQKQLDD
ncbi:hypothetical protein QQF64_034054 [Cirrhinus molitorella]|uniref:Uncharacterized protein n=1 Tax=Cirrhinus molitorella TaxID=172907 RepID=A0ABR3MVK9_9TELE